MRSRKRKLLSMIRETTYCFTLKPQTILSDTPKTNRSTGPRESQECLTCLSVVTRRSMSWTSRLNSLQHLDHPVTMNKDFHSLRVLTIKLMITKMDIIHYHSLHLALTFHEMVRKEAQSSGMLFLGKTYPRLWGIPYLGTMTNLCPLNKTGTTAATTCSSLCLTLRSRTPRSFTVTLVMRAQGQKGLIQPVGLRSRKRSGVYRIMHCFTNQFLTTPQPKKCLPCYQSNSLHSKFSQRVARTQCRRKLPLQGLVKRKSNRRVLPYS